MKITQVPIERVLPYARNPRKNDAAVEPVMNSIKEFGFINPIIVDKNMVVIAGHTRLKAAKELGMEKVPIIQAEHLTDAQVKAFRLADNKSAEIAEWNTELLSLELKELQSIAADIDMTSMGFSMEDFGLGDGGGS